MPSPFSPAVLAQVARLGGTWHDVPVDAPALTRVQAVSFPHPLMSVDDPDTHEWQAGDIVYQWEEGLGVDFPAVDLAAGQELAVALQRFRDLVADPRASRAVLLTYSEGYPNYHFINADDPRPEDPSVWATDHEGFFLHMEGVAPSLSSWLSQKLSE
ncbi:hypothetical protein [Corynebacterium nasicanis]|uniref:Uncharacterized protein n=1 Tax=Corynebacterium nasicanis TaxID=1448267 RepID=A0ABW1QAJ4_9CORY